MGISRKLLRANGHMPAQDEVKQFRWKACHLVLLPKPRDPSIFVVFAASSTPSFSCPSLLRLCNNGICAGRLWSRAQHTLYLPYIWGVDVSFTYYAISAYRLMRFGATVAPNTLFPTPGYAASLATKYPEPFLEPRKLILGLLLASHASCLCVFILVNPFVRLDALPGKGVCCLNPAPTILPAPFTYRGCVTPAPTIFPAPTLAPAPTDVPAPTDITAPVFLMSAWRAFRTDLWTTRKPARASLWTPAICLVWALLEPQPVS